VEAGGGALAAVASGAAGVVIGAFEYSRVRPCEGRRRKSAQGFCVRCLEGVWCAHQQCARLFCFARDLHPEPARLSGSEQIPPKNTV